MDFIPHTLLYTHIHTSLALIFKILQSRRQMTINDMCATILTLVKNCKLNKNMRHVVVGTRYSKLVFFLFNFVLCQFIYIKHKHCIHYTRIVFYEHYRDLSTMYFYGLTQLLLFPPVSVFYWHFPLINKLI